MIHLAKSPMWLNALALGFVILAGGLCVAMPFWGDQALFTVYARQLTEGAVLYRDIFDVKQPGIFVFYAFGGLLFGFSEIGIHLFELIYWLAFCAFAVVALRPYFTTRWSASLVPVFTVAVYYFYAGLLDIGQVEILVAFPLLASWWLLDHARPETSRGITRYAAAGLAAATVVLLKHLYLLIVLAFLGYVALRSVRRGIRVGALGRAFAAFFIMLVVPLVIVAFYFAAYGQLERIWWAYFEMAPAAQLFTPRPLSYLIVGFRRFMIGHGPIVILAVLGCVDVIRKRDRPRLDLAAGMVLWVALGAIAFLVLQGWPEYKWPLFTVPLGILAVMGVEVLVDLAGRLRRKPRVRTLAVATALGIVSFGIGAPVPQVQTQLLMSVAVGVFAAVAVGRGPRIHRAILYVLFSALAVSVGLAAIAPIKKLRAVIYHDFVLTADARLAFQHSWSGSYRAADEDIATLQRGEVLPGAIYVFGDPVLLYRANRPQAVPILGWGPEFLDNRAWRQLGSDLGTTLPPYIVVDPNVQSVIRIRYSPIMHMIESKYEVAFVGGTGTWYLLKDLTISNEH